MGASQAGISIREANSFTIDDARKRARLICSAFVLVRQANPGAFDTFLCLSVYKGKFFKVRTDDAAACRRGSRSPAIYRLVDRSDRESVRTVDPAASAALASRRMRSTIERKPLERCGVRCSRRPSFSNSLIGVGRENVLGAFAGVERKQHGDQAAHDMRVAVAFENAAPGRRCRSA